MNSEVVGAAKGGDTTEAGKLVAEHYASVLRFLLMLTGNSDDAEDLTQECFLRALRHFRSFRGESSVKTWLHRIAYREFTHRLRVRPAVPIIDEPVSHPFEGRTLLVVDLERALLRVAEHARAAFILCEIEELSVREASQVLRVPEGTIKSRVYNARQQLQSWLSQGEQITIQEVSHGTPR